MQHAQYFRSDQPLLYCKLVESSQSVVRSPIIILILALSARLQLFRILTTGTTLSTLIELESIILDNSKTTFTFGIYVREDIHSIRYKPASHNDHLAEIGEYPVFYHSIIGSRHHDKVNHKLDAWWLQREECEKCINSELQEHHTCQRLE